MATAATDPDRYFQIRDEQLKAYKADFFPNKEATAGNRYFGGLMDSIAVSATTYARSISMEIGYEDQDFSEFHDLLADVFFWVRDLAGAVTSYEDSTRDSYKPWYHKQYVMREALDGEMTDFDRMTLEGLVGRYLDWPFRHERVDRLLVDLLMACEIFAFGRETKHQIKAQTAWGWIKYRFYNLLFWGAVVWLAYVLASWGWISNGTADGTLMVAVFLYILEIVISLFLARKGNPAGKLLREMSLAYTELSSSGPISVSRVEERAKAAGDAGVGWPPPLYVLLEDIKSRTTRF